jgi:G3E family GTPase
MTPIRIVMLGGFLGAGKTTAIARLARMYQNQGQRVGIVTNDQGTELVDTHSLRSQGFDVGEVPGACFCANINDLIDTVQHLGTDERPEVVLSEPIGSCTDLVATVIRPLEQLFGQRFTVAPYGVILKPSHGERILSGREKAGFSPKAEYLFRKQLEEADFLLVNRIDELRAGQLDELIQRLAVDYPDTPSLRVSARTGAGFDAVFDFLQQRGSYARRALQLDYATYAAAEAELAWLNSSIVVRAEASFSLDHLLVSLIERLREHLQRQSAEPAHLKAIGLSQGSYGVANAVSSWTPVELSLPSGCQAREATVILNARVAIDAISLRQLAEAAVENAAAAIAATAECRQLECFHPGQTSAGQQLVQISL